MSQLLNMAVDVGSTMAAAYKRGGLVKKTGPALLHKGERVLTKKQARGMKKR